MALEIAQQLLPDVQQPTPSAVGFFDDFYYQLMTSSWPRFLSGVAAAFLMVNGLFALAYLFGGGIKNARPGSFTDAFFFSVQTMATIGYGRMAPEGLVANIVVSIEAVTGLLSFALVTGLVFSKFSRPSARVRFSRRAVISMRDGVPSLMFRMANVRANQIVEAQIHVVFSRMETTLEGEEVRRFYDLDLARERNAIFVYSWTAIHPIDESSPFYGTSAESLAASDARVTVSLTGMDDTFSQTVHARYYYDAKEIVWGARLANITRSTPDGGTMLDLAHFDNVVAAPLPPLQVRANEVQG